MKFELDTKKYSLHGLAVSMVLKLKVQKVLKYLDTLILAGTFFFICSKVEKNDWSIKEIIRFISKIGIHTLRTVNDVYV